jgi:hypothetical protein
LREEEPRWEHGLDVVSFPLNEEVRLEVIILIIHPATGFGVSGLHERSPQLGGVVDSSWGGIVTSNEVDEDLEEGEEVGEWGCDDKTWGVVENQVEEMVPDHVDRWLLIEVHHLGTIFSLLAFSLLFSSLQACLNLTGTEFSLVVLLNEMLNNGSMDTRLNEGLGKLGKSRNAISDESDSIQFKKCTQLQLNRMLSLSSEIAFLLFPSLPRPSLSLVSMLPLFNISLRRTTRENSVPVKLRHA